MKLHGVQFSEIQLNQVLFFPSSLKFFLICKKTQNIFSCSQLYYVAITIFPLSFIKDTLARPGQCSTDNSELVLIKLMCIWSPICALHNELNTTLDFKITMTALAQGHWLTLSTGLKRDVGIYWWDGRCKLWGLDFILQSSQGFIFGRGPCFSVASKL